ncbi:MAG: AhpC/TSA family protein [Bacteroidales bacterium]|nr:AhpC/TSA family protein [Bacteroidales bacterium]
MKKLFFILSLCIFVACTNQQSRIKGRISGSKGQLLYFEHIDASDIKTIDSVKLRNSGRFSFSARVKMPDFYQLRLEENQIISLLVKPAESITVTANGADVSGSLDLKGSFESENLNKLIRYLNETKVMLDSINDLYLRATEDTARERYNKEYLSILEDHRKYSMAYILTHTRSMTCIYVLYQQLSPGNYVFYKTADLQFFKIVSDTLGKYYPRSKHVIAFRKNTSRLLNDFKTQSLLSRADTIKKGLPEVKLKDLNGIVRNIATLKGKYVLLSFWASWNEDCIEQNLQLKTIYEKYRGHDFEIMQVSFDNSTVNWKRAVHYDELPWINVIDTTFPNSSLAVRYNVQYLPANYLIDKDNITILAKDISPEQLQQRLSELSN